METGNVQEADSAGEDSAIVSNNAKEFDETNAFSELDVEGERQEEELKEEGTTGGEEKESSREASETPTLIDTETENEVDSTGVKFQNQNEEDDRGRDEDVKGGEEVVKSKEEDSDVKEEEFKLKEDIENEARSTVVSPKILRPKLPDFKENGQIKTGGHSRSKTDPGKGSDIKAIIDKTVEDIKVLNQVDFTKTYSRPKKFPKPFAQKSQSTHASPRASPTSCSPCIIDDSASSLNRNRSRSLKILTDILKSGRGGAGNIPKDAAEEGKSVSDSHLVPRKPSLVKEEDCERRSSSDGQIGKSSESSKKKVSTGSIARDSGTADSDKTNYSTPEVPSPSEETRDIKSPVRKKDFSKFRRAKSEVRKLAVSDDEGVGESDQEAPHTAGPKSYHTIDTNSKFFTLWKTGAPKRRSGFAGLVQSVYNKDDMSRGDQPYIGPRKLHRVELKPIPSSRKISSIRHVTHPPTSKITFREDGALDSNGFGTILKSPTTDRPPPLPGELDSQASELSLADSQLGESVTDDTASFQDALESMVNDPYEYDNDRPIEKKNGKLKPKSRSDPSGEKLKENMDFPKVVTSAHSSPILSKSSEGEELEEDEGSEDTVKSEEISSMTEHAKEKRELRASLSLDENVLEKGSSENILSPDSSFDAGLGQEEVKSGVKFLSFYTDDISGPSSPRNESPTGTPERQPNHLEVPHPTSGSTSKKGIGRSASSASVLVRERKNSAEKKENRKHSLTPAEEGSDKINSLPLSDSRVESTSLPALNKPLKDKRFHIVEELYRNEQEYVDALTVLKDKYMLPLKTSCSSVDENLVDNIFYMIPEILMHHTVYQNSLDKVWKNWDIKSTIGNVIVATFSKQTVIDCYISFVENYKTSGKVIENALQTKSSVQKFIEQCHRDSGSKLTMKDLIVRPIQRIPRYELLIQRLIEHTPRDHPDFLLLKEAEKVMHDFAIKLGTVNETQHEEDQQESLKRLELLLITDLAVPERQYLRHDMVNIITKKDQCCVWMFSDLIIVSSVKRRSGPVTRKVSIILKSPTGQDFAENIKHKVWLRVGLHAVEIVKNQTLVSQQKSVDPEQLEDDINLLNDINDLTSKLSCPHSSLDEVVQEMLNSLGKQYSEVALRNSTADSNKLDLLVTTQERIYPLEVSFNSAEKRSQWESTFYDAKQKLAMMSDKRAPEFLQALPITKTRAGMQFSCAAPIDGLNAKGHRDVWVCNSDGYVGHMCLLSLQPEPIVTLNTPVPGCNARILCICAVPAYSGTFRRKSSAKKNNRGGVSREGPQIQIEEVEDTGTEEEEELSNNEDNEDNEDGYQTDSESSGKESESMEDVTAEDGEVNANVEDPGIEIKPLNVSEITQSTPDSITCSGNWNQDPHKSTMWLGTEDGCIHIFQSTDNIKTTKNKLKIHHESPVYCIVYLDNKVFVSLANGDLIVYKRDAEGVWDSENPYTRSIGTAQSPITRMLAVAGKLWCGCQNVIKVINPLTLSTETSFTISSNSNRGVQSLVCSGQGVWLASQQSSKILLYHATSYEFLMEVSIAQAVSQKLQSADDIIRQHKAACLRITSLLICKDLLWIGTSAGVILTVPTPRITSTTNRGSISSPSVTGLVYGHTGHVRFLTCVEMNAPLSSNKSDSESDDKPSEAVPPHDMHRRSSMAATTATLATRMLVISGGDGYEDFRSNASNESAGRDDSTNHLLLWQV